MSYKYNEIIDDLRRQILTPALASRAKKAIEELLYTHELDQAEIVRLRRMVEMKEDEKWRDLREGNRSPYREETAAERRARYKRREFTPDEEEDLMTTLMLSEV